MTTASRPSGIGSPVSTTSKAAGESQVGVVSLAPSVPAARTAMPSIPAASNGGEDRTAHTGAAVTSPAASVTGTVTAGSRSGQPAASRAARHAARACAAGTSLMNGLSGIQDHVHLAARVEPGRLVWDHNVAVGRGQDRQQRRQAEHRYRQAVVDLDLDDVKPAGR